MWDPERVGFSAFSCTDLDSVQKFLDWHLEYFFLSTNVCWNNIWTLEIILSPHSGFAQKSTKSMLAQSKTKFKKSKQSLKRAKRT